MPAPYHSRTAEGNAQKHYPDMMNRAMARKLVAGECVDLSECERHGDGSYIVPDNLWQEGIDYCDAKTERWIWSIGVHKETGERRAATDARFYEAPAWKCIWLR